MKWTPQEIIKIIALISAIIMFALGAIMMWQGISAEGVIDLKSSLLSGSLKTGSAGLFISFLSVVIIIFIIIYNSRSIEQLESKENNSQSMHTKAGKIFWAVLTMFLVSIALASNGYGVGFAAAAILLGFLLFMVTIAWLASLDFD